MPKSAIVGAMAVLLIVINAREGSSQVVADCGPHSHIVSVTPRGTGGLFTHCQCDPGYKGGPEYKTASQRTKIHLRGCQRAGGNTRTATIREPTQRRACSVCSDALRRNVQVHIGQPSRFQTYVDQAIAGYDNCKQKATGDCSTGDVLVRTLRNACSTFKEETPFHACIARIFGR